MTTRSERRHKTRAKHTTRVKTQSKLCGTLPDKLKQHLRDQATICSCEMCCNPRRSKLSKKSTRLTIQERRAPRHSYGGPNVEQDSFMADEHL